jgi:hypothetical protein
MQENHCGLPDAVHNVPRDCGTRDPARRVGRSRDRGLVVLCGPGLAVLPVAPQPPPQGVTILWERIADSRGARFTSPNLCPRCQGRRPDPEFSKPPALASRPFHTSQTLDARGIRGAFLNWADALSGPQCTSQATSRRRGFCCLSILYNAGLDALGGASNPTQSRTALLRMG